MFENKKLKNWSETYWNQIKRNIGLIKISEQEKLRNNTIAVFGVGGLGGPLVEQLVRAGCENLVICDNDEFTASNLNRQLCTREDIGLNKVDVIEAFLKKINPDINLQKYYEINEYNISNVLNNVSVVALTLDDPIASILIARKCRKKKTCLLESWAIPYLCAWWFSPESIDYETCYGLNTHKMSVEDIKKSDSTISELKYSLLSKLLLFPNIKERFDREKGAVDGLFSGKLASISLAPIVRMNASYLAFEIIYAGIVKAKKMILAPKMTGYDYLEMKPIEFKLI